MTAAPPLASGHHSWPQRLLLTFNAVVLIGCLVAGSVGGYLYYRFGQVGRVHVQNLQPRRPPGEPQNYLLVGSDSRAFVESGSADEESFGTTSDAGVGGRADTIIIVRVDPRTRRAAMMSLPRDLWVSIAGTGHEGKINTAFLTGPERLIETIHENFGITIDHYAQVDFKGFKDVVDAVGGVTVYLASPVRDWDTTVSPARNETGLHIIQTGCVELNGTQALAYVRSRHFQTMDADGDWHTDGTGDFGRINRQQDFVRRAVKQALAKGMLNPLKLNRLMSIGVHNVNISDTITPSNLIELGRNFGTLSAKTLQQYKLPAISDRHGSQSTVGIPSSKQGEAERIFDVFRGVSATPNGALVPSAVTVRVLNGSGRVGEAATTTDALGQVGFGTDTPGTTSPTGRTVVRYPAGQEAEARLLARWVQGGADLEQVHGVSGVDVVLVTGDDFTGIAEKALPESAVTTTTTAPATTTTTAPVPDC